MTGNNKLVLSECTDTALWDTFVANSPHGNVFCRTAFINALGEDYDLSMVKKDGKPQLGVMVLKQNGRPISAPYPFTMYQGILFDSSYYGMSYHSRLKWALEITEFLLVEMEQRYERISFCLHYRVEDLRPFQWFHYHQPELGQFKIDLRYTGLLDLTAMPDFDAYLSTVRKVRRYEYRHAQSAGFIVEESADIETLERLHRLTFERQGIQRSEAEARLLKNISQAALSAGFGKLLFCKDKKGSVASASLFLYDNHCGYYLFGANDPVYRNTGSGTYVLLAQIRECKNKGFSKVDLVGINSPNRGDFKTSFNALPVPYFVATWERPA